MLVKEAGFTEGLGKSERAMQKWRRTVEKDMDAIINKTREEVLATEGLASVIDASTASVDRYARSQRNASRAASQVTSAQAAATSAMSRTNYHLSQSGKLFNQTRDSTRLANHELNNLTFQLQDVVVGLYSGQKPMTVFIQQGSQIAGIAAASGKSLKEMGSAMLGLVSNAGIAALSFLASPTGLAIAAGVAAGAFAIKGISDALDEGAISAKDYAKAMGLASSETESLVNALEKAKVFKVSLGGLLKMSATTEARLPGFYMGRGGFEVVGFEELKKAYRESEEYLKKLGEVEEAALQGAYDRAVQAYESESDKVLRKYKEDINTMTAYGEALEKQGKPAWEHIRALQAERALKFVSDMGAVTSKMAKADEKDAAAAEKKQRALEAAKRTLMDISKVTSFGLDTSTVEAQVQKFRDSVSSDLRKGLISKEDAKKAFSALDDYLTQEAPKAAVKAMEAYNKATDPLYEFNMQLDWQREGFKLVGTELENFNEYQKVYNALLSQGIDLDQSKNKVLDEYILKTISALNIESKRASIRNALYGASPTKSLADNALHQDELNKLIAQGGDDTAYYESELRKATLSAEQFKAVQEGWGTVFGAVKGDIAEATERIKEYNAALAKNPNMDSAVKAGLLSAKNRDTFTVAGAGDVYGGSFRGTTDSLIVSQKQWDSALKAGLVTTGEYENAMRGINSEYLKNAALTGDMIGGTESFASGLKLYADDFKGTFAELQEIGEQFYTSLGDGIADAFARSVVTGDSFKDSLHGLSQTILVELVGSIAQMGIKYALATALGHKMTMAQLLNINTVAAASTAANATQTAQSAASLPVKATDAALTNAATFGAGALAGAAALGLIIGLAMSSIKGFATGGFITGAGTGTSDSILARVSNGESIINASATKKYAPMIAAMNAGADILPGSASAGSGVRVTIENNSLAQVSARRISEREVRIIAEEVVATKTDKYTASNLANANSKTSKSLYRNTRTVRDI
jgi:hypothetical protein